MGLTVKRSSTGAMMFKKWAEWEKGDIIVGKFLKTREDNYDKTNYIVEPLLEECKCSFIDELEAAVESDKTFNLNYNGSLGFQMEDMDVQVGEYVRIEYTGTEMIYIEKMKKEKETHTLKLSVVSLDTEVDVAKVKEVQKAQEKFEEDELL